MTKFYTAQMAYKGRDGELVLDITAKSSDDVIGFAFAPSWEYLSAYQQGIDTWEQYCTHYRNHMRENYRRWKKVWLAVLTQEHPVVFKCYCGASKLPKCHRCILMPILAKVAVRHLLPFDYMGEIDKFGDLHYSGLWHISEAGYWHMEWYPKGKPK